MYSIFNVPPETKSEWALSLLTVQQRNNNDLLYFNSLELIQWLSPQQQCVHWPWPVSGSVLVHWLSSGQTESVICPHLPLAKFTQWKLSWKFAKRPDMWSPFVWRFLGKPYVIKSTFILGIVQKCPLLWFGQHCHWGDFHVRRSKTSLCQKCWSMFKLHISLAFSSSFLLFFRTSKPFDLSTIKASIPLPWFTISIDFSYTSYFKTPE